MVSLWPWKVDDTASFERTLSALTSKISKAGVKLNTLRTRSRRYKALWTLYTTAAYIFGTLILVLVTGWQNWSPQEYAVVAGSPFIIYAGRLGLDRYYAYRISSAQTHLDDLNQQRATAIEKFKNATKYNSTQKLLEKYGAAPSSSSTSISTFNPASGVMKRQASGANTKPQQRTGLPPPPTANIRRPEQAAAMSSPLGQQATVPQTPVQPLDIAPTEEFAPNAFTPSPRDYAFSGTPSFSVPSLLRTSAQQQHSRRWYDRFLDVLLCEDETRASNRLALICTNCRLVNGQAPPGVQRLEEVGKWRCSECGAWNGAESEVNKMIEAVGGITGRPVVKREESEEIGAVEKVPRPWHKNKLDGIVDEDESLAEQEVVPPQDDENDSDVYHIDEDTTPARVEESDMTDTSSTVDTSSARSTWSRSKRSKK